MEKQAIIFRTFSLYPIDLIDLTPEAPPMPEPPRTTATIDDLAQMVMDRLKAQVSLLYPLIEDERASPTERGRTPRVHIMTALRLCEALTEMAIEANDEFPVEGQP